MTYSYTLNPFRLYSTRRVGPYFSREFKRVGARPLRVRIGYTDAGNPPRDVLIERRGQQLTLVLESAATRWFSGYMRYKVCAFAYWLSLSSPEVRQITVNASDGETVSNARFAASVRLRHHVGLPDPHFFQNNGFAAEVERGRMAPPWDDRSSEIVWRGGMNGCGWASFAPEDIDNPAVMQRIRMVQRLRGVAQTDARFVDLHPTADDYGTFAHNEGFLGQPVAAETWLGRKFAVDIDGYTNTWSNLLVRMLYGCCVLKVSSQFGFRQWYYDELRPFEHYVPVASDMSDLHEKIEWVRSHDTEARAIAERGQALSRTLTFESQARRAARLIEEHWDR
ncbi:glycosyl transferase family 90 [Rhizobium cauense]|uniref:glycosyl transferase family 90 n=1 Tax=Rhizobium cauense TaxID=1166683 RepID=UPI001CB78DA5|nr:glycosyl transferase family 90 [Rhizobium cauense]